MSSTTTPLNFFAIIQVDDSEEIRLLRTSSAVQQQLSDIFQKEASHFTDPNLEHVAFSQTYNTDTSEVFSITDFELNSDIEPAIDDPASIDSLDISSGDLPPIKAIFTGWKSDNGELNVAFQLFKKNQYLTRSGISLIISKDTFTELSTPGIIITYELVAFYQNGTLLFDSFFQARQIFKLADHYRQSTQADIDDFVSHEKILIADSGAFNEIADSWVRRKLAIIHDRGLLDQISTPDIASKASSFGITIQTDSVDGVDVIRVPDDKKEVKELLRFLDEDYFEGPLSAAKYLSNSKRSA